MAEVFKDPRKLEYLNAEGADRPLRSPIPQAMLVAARGYRKRRMAEQVGPHGCTAILLFDPVNIRYTLDARNMQLWAAHNPFHYALVFADGHGSTSSTSGAEHLVDGLEDPRLRGRDGAHLRAVGGREDRAGDLGRAALRDARSGGEWLETRLLAAGERTNPWFQECSDHVAASGDMLAFDTDMIGPYGYCADLSRSWTIDHVATTPERRPLYAAALEQIELIQPGMDYREYMERSWPIPGRYLANRYACLPHGVGLCDEYSGVYAPQDAADFQAGRFDPGMVLAVESLIGEEGGHEAVKLETQVLVTDSGAERLDSFPWEDA